MASEENKNKILPDKILLSILKTGLVIVGGPDVGKSVTAKAIVSEIIGNPQPVPIQVKIFDSASNWRWNFDEILCQRIDENVRHFYDGPEHILFDIRLIDEEEMFKFMEKVILTDYLRQGDRKDVLEGHNDKYILYIVEEAQIAVLAIFHASRAPKKWQERI